MDFLPPFWIWLCPLKQDVAAKLILIPSVIGHIGLMRVGPPAAIGILCYPARPRG